MFDDSVDTGSRLSTGAKVALLAGVPFIFLGLYFLLGPITEVRTQTGGVFGCGSGLFPPGDKFKSNICGPINSMYMYRGLLSIAAGLVISAGGYVLFGKAKTVDNVDTFPEPLERQTGSRQRARSFD